ncbi:MAG: GMC family oxidoreductase [Flavobacteriaceae bacterium]|nr:GMC family oxidoreductase [Flavobacteriaceae bacterium]
MSKKTNNSDTYDYVIVGSGFGGSVSALRLSEKGYKVLVIEKGRWYKNEDDFPKTSWDLRKYLWLPSLGWKGLMKISQFAHVGILSGIGVGGGSLVYASTLPIPNDKFYNSGSWKNLANWKEELTPYYDLAYKMLGAKKVDYEGEADKVWKTLVKDLGKEAKYERTKVGVFMGEPGTEVDDPYFDGEGPRRKGCIYCASCSIGCRHNAKNSLDKNYLYLAQNLGCEIMADSLVTAVNPLDKNGASGYEITYRNTYSRIGKRKKVRANGVIFSGGVLGTVELLLEMKHKNILPKLSKRLGMFIRTNSESLLTVTNLNGTKSFTDGVQIGSIIHTDENTHIEPNTLGTGNGFARIITFPILAFGKNLPIRIWQHFIEFAKAPIDFFKAFLVNDFGRHTIVLLFMQTLEGTMSFKKKTFGRGMKSVLGKGEKPKAFIPFAKEIAHKIEHIIDGKAGQQVLQTVFGSASTAHILGGCCMGETSDEGVIDRDNKVFGYHNMYVFDGSMISSNPGVNPSLSITAIAEHGMSKIPFKKDSIEQKMTGSNDLSNEKFSRHIN